MLYAQQPLHIVNKIIVSLMYFPVSVTSLSSASSVRYMVRFLFAFYCFFYAFPCQFGTSRLAFLQPLALYSWFCCGILMKTKGFHVAQ